MALERHALIVNNSKWSDKSLLGGWLLCWAGGVGHAASGLTGVPAFGDYAVGAGKAFCFARPAPTVLMCGACLAAAGAVSCMGYCYLNIW